MDFEIRKKVKKILLYTLLVIFQLINNAHAQVPKQEKKIEPVDLVYPLLDASNSRWFYFNSATRPFGMVNLSPGLN